MSRRDLTQPSFVDAMVSGYGKVGGFLDRIEQGFDWSAFEALLSPIHSSAMGAPGYPPLTMFKTLEARGLVGGIAWNVKHPRYPLETWQKLHILGGERALSRRARLRH